VAEREIPYEVPELEYVDVESRWLARLRANIDDWWGDQTPIASCVRCGRYMADPNRDSAGDPMHQDPEDDREAVCLDCLEKALIDGLKRGMEGVIDERLDLSDKGRTTLKKVVELVVTEPDKVLELKDLGNRVRHLESQNKLLWTMYGGAILVLLVALAALWPPGVT
jgi:hypothetical protein